MKLREEINTGECASNLYGYSWTCPYRGVRIYYPIPLNVVARIVRKAYFFLRRNGINHDVQLYNKGFDDGREYSNTHY